MSEKQSWTCPQCGEHNTTPYCMGCGIPKASISSIKTNKSQAKTSGGNEKNSTGNADKTHAKMRSPVLPIFFTIAFTASCIFLYSKYQETNQVQSTATAEYSTKTSKSTGQNAYSESKNKNLDKNKAVNKSTNNTSKKSETQKKYSGPDLALNNFELGMTINQMHSRIGKEHSKKIVDGITYYYYPGVKVASEGNKIDFIQSSNEAVSTNRDISSGDRLSDVVDAYGDNAMKTNYDNLILYEYNFRDQAGRSGIIRFAANKDTKKIDYISVRISDYKG